MAHKKPTITPQQRANYLARNSENVRVDDDAVRFNFTSSSMGYPDTTLTCALKNVAHALDVSLDMDELLKLQAAKPSPTTGMVSGITVSDLSDDKFDVSLIGEAKKAYDKLVQETGVAGEKTAAFER